MKNKRIYILLVVIFQFMMVALFSEDEEENDFDLNKKVEIKIKENDLVFESVPLLSEGEEGLTVVKKNDKLLYSFNEYAPNLVASKDGQYLVLFFLGFDGSSGDDEAFYKRKLFSIFKNGILVRSFAVKDLFSFKPDLYLRYYYERWLAYELVSEEPTPIKEPLVIQDDKKLKVLLSDGHDLIVDLDTGKILEKKLTRADANTFSSLDSLKNVEQIKNMDLELHRVLSVKVDVVEAYGLKLYTGFCFLEYKGFEFKVIFKTDSIEVLKDEIIKFSKCLDTFVQRYKTKAPKGTFKFLISLSCRKGEVYLSPYLPYNNTFLSDYLWNTRERLVENMFFVREYNGGEFEGLPYLVQFKTNDITGAFEFTKLSTIGGVKQK